MFIQIIEGKTSDPQGLKRQLDRWQEECRPGATGWLGVTSGVAADGTFVALVRFESEDAARANSERPEQGAWWSETEKYFDGEVSFADTSDVEIILGGGRDDAGFVQIMQGTCANRARAREVEDATLDSLRQYRPEVLGMVRAWTGDRFTEAAYFTDEASARQGEAADLPPEMAESLAEYMGLFEDMRYVDLTTPWFQSA